MTILETQDASTLPIDSDGGGDKPPTNPLDPQELLTPDGAYDLQRFACRAYLAYAISVVKGRALPDISDGLKPVHRRVLFAMQRLGLSSTSKKVKSARVVGDVIGKYHPHGDQTSYQAIVRIAQSFTLRYPLIDGQGNFGSRDGDGAAAMRYTEMRLTAIAETLLSEIDAGTVDFIPNYDGSFEEPRLLPARLPMLLLNGASGIAVGMACEVPSHNIREVISACLLLIERPDASIDDVMKVLPGPDYPCGGQIICSPRVLRDAYETGRGSIRMRALWRKEELARGQWRVVIYEHAHEASTKKVLEEIEQLTNPKVRDGKKELSPAQKNAKALVLSVLDQARDESYKDEPVRLVLEPKSSRQSPGEMMATLFASTSLECSAPMNMTVIGRDGNPQTKGIISVLKEWIGYRFDTVERRIKHRLSEVRRRLHILDGRLQVFIRIEEVIRIIRESDDPKLALMRIIGLTEPQAEDILEIRLRQLARLAGIEIEKEALRLRDEEAELQLLLDDRHAFTANLVKELRDDERRFADDRRTLIEHVEVTQIARTSVDEPVTVFVSAHGWVRVRQGHGVDRSSMPWKTGDAEGAVLETRTTHPLVVIDTNGQAYSVDIADIPSVRGDGVPLNSLLSFADGGRLAHALSDASTASYLFANSSGYGFITELSNLVGRNKGGKRFMTLEPQELVLQPVRVTDTKHWIAACSQGPKDSRMVLFPAHEMKIMPKGRGVIMMNLKEGEHLSVATVLPCDPPSEVTIELSSGQKLSFKGDDLKRFLLHRARSGCQIGKRVDIKRLH